jgi:hypothetical protein
VENEKRALDPSLFSSLKENLRLLHKPILYTATPSLFCDPSQSLYLKEQTVYTICSVIFLSMKKIAP